MLTVLVYDSIKPKGTLELLDRMLKKTQVAMARYGPAAALLIFWFIVLEQRTLGEAAATSYASMSLPGLLWFACLVVAGVVLVFVKRRYLAGAFGISALMSIFLLWDPSCGAANPKAKASLPVMTFNVEKFRAFKPEQVAAVIRKANPDIVCLQEVAPLDAPRLIPKTFHQALPGYQVIQRGETAIVTKYPVSFGAVFALRGGEGGRPAQMATIMVGRQPVSVICVHMQYFPWDGSLGISQASDNFMKETRSLEDLVRDPGISTIIAGDFNTVPHGRVHRMLRKYLQDCFAETGRGFGFTMPASFPLRRLDYVYAGRGLKPLRTWVASSIASDHRAVISDLQFGP
jgi:vancomycin resistance protein VanJ